MLTFKYIVICLSLVSVWRVKLFNFLIKSHEFKFVLNYVLPFSTFSTLIFALIPKELPICWFGNNFFTFQELRNRFIFKVVPMLNPDGVIVGNYRCSLAARDLNRNYRHPRKESFPTVWFTKSMMEKILERHDVGLSRRQISDKCKNCIFSGGILWVERYSYLR